MKQLLLDVDADKPQTLESFVVGQNAELVHLLRAVQAETVSSLSARSIYLWGEEGVGKSHLLSALAASAHARYIAASAPVDTFLFVPEIRLYLIDDCECLSADRQIAAFNLFNQARENGGVLVAAGNKPPAALTVREDLRTRLGWGLIYQVHGLTDQEKSTALAQSAHLRGLPLPPGVLPYLLTHFRRDMRSLSVIIDALAQYSLETQRPVTLPLLRSLLQQELLDDDESGTFRP